MRSLIIFSIIIVCLACDKKPDENMNAHSHEQHETQSIGIMLTESQLRLANVNTLKITSSIGEKQLSVNARLVTNEELTEVVSSRMRGRVEKLYFKETGKFVNKGQPLYELYSEELLTLQNDFLLALSQYNSFQTTRYENYLKASRKKLILYGLTEKQVDKLAEEKSVQQRITFLAPVSGTIKELNVAEGQYINEGDVLYRLENTRQLWVEAELYPGEGKGLKPGAVLQVKVNGFENNPMNSEVKFISPEYLNNSQILIIRSVIDNKDGQWKSGMQAQVFITEKNNKTLFVPADAVIRDAHGAMMIVKSDDYTFAPRMVKTGIETNSGIEILDGVKEGEEVVISGAYLIYSEMILKNGSEFLAHQH